MISSWGIGVAVVTATFGATILGFRLQASGLKQHLTPETKDVVKLVIGILGTLSAIVLGLMIGSARGSYDRQREEVNQLATKLVSLDRSLERFGPETKPVRLELKRLVGGAAERIWPTDSTQSVNLDPGKVAEAWLRSLEDLVPATDAQRSHQGRAMSLAMEVMNTRWLLYQRSLGSESAVLLTLITVWFALIFFCIGMLAPRNPMVLAMLLICALSVSGAVILGIELDRPFDGLLRISGEPILRAIANMGQ